MNYTILLPSRPYIEREKENSADIVIDGLHPGYGVTLGNALRRVLFSSLPGAAVTRVKIKGVNHEFSTIPGVLEDVLLILLNIKQLRFRVHTDGPEVVSFEAKGEGEIKASDIKTSSNLEIVNKKQHIATITKKGTDFSVELTVERGVGYRSKENIETERLEAGSIVLDSIFTPIRKVSYQVTNMRVGTDTNYNKLTFSIETDGSISPAEAFSQSVEVLMSQLGELKEFGKKEEYVAEELAAEREAPTEESNGGEEYLKIPIEDVKFSSHTLNALTRAGLNTVGDLSDKSEKDLKLIDGIGDKAVQEIHRELGNFGIMLPKE
ncbi:MAG: DNA-directed RNA polymerase subunit alpha [bacterium]|nr:DNA-directed RNA polymerase subunit alpha [bacterium]